MRASRCHIVGADPSFKHALPIVKSLMMAFNSSSNVSWVLLLSFFVFNSATFSCSCASESIVKLLYLTTVRSSDHLNINGRIVFGQSLVYGNIFLFSEDPTRHLRTTLHPHPMPRLRTALHPHSMHHLRNTLPPHRQTLLRLV